MASPMPRDAACSAKCMCSKVSSDSRLSLGTRAAASQSRQASGAERACSSVW
jgi:hypothetical protein